MRPILFSLGDLAIYSFGTAIILGFVLGLFLLRQAAMRLGLNFGFVRQHLLGLAVAALLGARIFDALFTGQWWPWQGGLSLSGAVLATLVYFRQLARKEHQEFKVWLDAGVVASLGGAAVGYLGYFLAGRGLGPVTSRNWLAWSVVERIDFSSSGLPVVPLSLIMVLACAVLAVALWRVLPLIRKRGLVFCLGWTGYYAAVWLTERLRAGDDVTYYWGEANVTGWLAGVFALLGLAWLALSFLRFEIAKKKRRHG